jgi:hypothetical protein
MSERSICDVEADSIARYLVGRPPGEREKRIYANAMQIMHLTLGPQEEMLWARMIRSHFWMACIDAGLALRRPAHSLRRKPFVMLAILEASPHYTDCFLSRRFPASYLGRLTWVGLSSAARSAIGILLLARAKIL